MPWVRLAPDRLYVLSLFNIELLYEESDFLWYDMPGKGKMRVQKKAPRIWFESTSDAHQAGGQGILQTQAERDSSPEHDSTDDKAADPSTS